MANPINGTSRDDILNGTSGDDIVSGLRGNDTIYATMGLDTLDGGDGNDTLVIDRRTESVGIQTNYRYIGGAGWDTLRLLTGAYSTGGTNSAPYLDSILIGADIEAFEVTGDFYATVANLANFQKVSLDGRLGLYGSGTLDWSYREITGRGAYEAVTFDIQSAVVLKLTGIDQGFWITTSANATVYGALGNDVMAGGNAADTFYGQEGDDNLTGGIGKDNLYGGDGEDEFVYGAQAEIVSGEVVSGGDGRDGIHLRWKDGSSQDFDISGLVITSVESLWGNEGKVTLKAAQLDAFQTLQSVAGVTISSTGAIDLTGADLGSLYTINLFYRGNTLNLGDVVTQVGVNGDDGNDTVTGGLGNDNLKGGKGNDTLNGGDGADGITGGQGADKLFGGDGDDQFLYDSPTEVAAGETVSGGAGYDYLVLNGNSGEFNLAVMSIGADVEGYSGRNAAMTVAQMNNFHSFTSGYTSQPFTIRLTTAGAVNASQAELRHSLTLKLHADGNTVDFSYAQTAPGVYGFHVTVEGGAGKDTITGTNLQGDKLNGGLGDDVIRGLGGHDFLYGGDGMDTQSGGNGNDTFIVRKQTELVAGEVYDGGSGTDAMDFNGMSRADISGVTLTSVEKVFNTALLTLTAAQLGKMTDITVNTIKISTAGSVSFANDKLTVDFVTLSNAGNTVNFTGARTDWGIVINGGSAADRIVGTDYGDFIAGNGGVDTLTGNSGSDAFSMIGRSTDMDRITDFSGAKNADGSIGEGDYIYFGREAGGGSAYIGAAAFSAGGISEVRFAGTNRIEVDYNGDGRSDRTIALDGVATAGQLTSADFHWDL